MHDTLCFSPVRKFKNVIELRLVDGKCVAQDDRSSSFQKTREDILALEEYKSDYAIAAMSLAQAFTKNGGKDAEMKAINKTIRTYLANTYEGSF